MSLKIPEILDHYWHDDIVRTIMRMNPQFHLPNRGSWLQGIPDLEDANRGVVEVALTDLRNSWGQCLYYYRMNASHIHFVLAPKMYLDYQNKEKAFIKANPIPKVDVYMLPVIPVNSKPKKRTKTKHVRKPEAKFTVTKEETETLKQIEQPKFDSEEGLNIDIDDDKFEVGEYIEVETIAEVTIPSLENGDTCSSCKELVREEGCPYPVCRKYNWEIAQDLTKRAMVCMGG